LYRTFNEDSKNVLKCAFSYSKWVLQYFQTVILTVLNFEKFF